MKKEIIFIYQDPTPYNIDLFNELAKSTHFSIKVIYTVNHDSGDGAHVYNYLPDINFPHIILNGNFKDILKIYAELKFFQNKEIVLMGYSNKLTILSLFLLKIKGIRFISEADGFNVGDPVGNFFFLKKILRNFLRSIFVNNSKFLLCAGGKKGKSEAVRIGFKEKCVVDFPYTISPERIISSKQSVVSNFLVEDLNVPFIIFVSARFIRRKGHKEFLNSVALIKNYNFIIWFEGMGPLSDEIYRLALSLGLENKVRFLGFCEMHLHNWLLFNSTIVVVPSLSDPWGIVVDEGMKLGKIVISTIFTGSAIDRIKNTENGFIYNPNKNEELSQILISIFTNSVDIKSIKSRALSTGIHFSPSFNRINFEKALQFNF